MSPRRKLCSAEWWVGLEITLSRHSERSVNVAKNLIMGELVSKTKHIGVY